MRSNLFRFFISSLLLFIPEIAFSINENDNILRLKKEKKHDSLAMALTEKLNREELSLKEYHWLGLAHYENSNYVNGALYAERLLHLAKQKADTSYIIEAYRLLYIKDFLFKRYDKSIETIRENLPYFRKKDSLLCASVELVLGLVYFENGQLDSAFAVYDRMDPRVFKATTLELDYFTNYSQFLGYSGQYDSAIFYFKKKIPIEKRMRYHNALAMTYSDISHLYMEKEEWEKCQAYMDSAMARVPDDPIATAHPVIYKNNFLIYKKLGKLDEALEALDSINAYNQRLFDTNVDQKAQILNDAYRREVDLKREVTVKGAQLEISQRRTLWSVIGVLAMLLVLVIISGFYIYRHSQNRQRYIGMKQRLMRSQMTPHFIFNSLSSIQGMILNDDKSKAVNYLGKFSKLMRLILENSNNRVVPLDRELMAVENYMQLQKMRFENLFDFTLRIDETIDPENIEIPPMLIQPFVENAIEHGFRHVDRKGLLDISLTYKNDNLFCTIQDNGSGINRKKQSIEKRSLSTGITRERLALFAKEFNCKGDLKIDSDDTGTTVNITIPHQTHYD
ncbi:hypothetical protein FUAX_19330 [Fulvitalea axinellae]|uniref:Signal transduction histidine kinase internal region domain-containing protein n=1 Tax=Fulvitalea axinellae TaxID=1182444 RepID=A0AAU9CBF5_9BACT|nr:hypothetical protein FUAX_19330 [Fulvitalea axinellae]